MKGYAKEFLYQFLGAVAFVVFGSAFFIGTAVMVQAVTK